MPREVRRIVFSYGETAKALESYGKKFNMNFSEGKLIKASYSNSPEYDVGRIRQMQEAHLPPPPDLRPRQVIFTFFNDTTLEHKYFTLPEDFILSAITEYCIEQKIILPKNAQKLLDVTDLSVALDLSSEDNPENTLMLEDDT